MKECMKIPPIGILFLLTTPWVAYSQGNFNFDNIGVNPGPAPVTVSSEPGTFNPADGPAGAYLGSNYSASLYYLSGAISDPAVFNSSNPILFVFADTQFLGTTGTGPGHGLSGDGSGFFDGGNVTLPTRGQITAQIRAWYNGGGLYTSYDQALAAGQNVGKSIPVPLVLEYGSFPPPYMDGLLPFTVGIAPEPSTFALFGLGGLALLHFARRRK
jgi:hypothetical protein